MRVRLLLIPGMALALLLFAENGAQAVAPATATGRITLGYNKRCTADAAMALVRNFVRNYNSGRVAVINGLWAPEPRFQWFSTGPPGARIGSRAYDRTTLTAYFRGRVRLHEKIRVVELRARYDSRRKVVDFAGKLVRSADDLRPTAPRVFKGAADCAFSLPSLIVWSM